MLAITLNYSKLYSVPDSVLPFALLWPASSSAHGVSSVAAPPLRATVSVDGQVNDKGRTMAQLDTRDGEGAHKEQRGQSPQGAS